MSLSEKPFIGCLPWKNDIDTKTNKPLDALKQYTPEC